MNNSNNNENKNLAYEDVVAEVFENSNQPTYHENHPQMELLKFEPDHQKTNHLWRFIVIIFTYLAFSSGVLSQLLVSITDPLLRNNSSFVEEIDSNYATYFYTKVSINGLGFIHVDDYDSYIQNEGASLLAVYEVDNYILVMNTYNGTLSDITNNNWFVYVEDTEGSRLSNYQLTPSAYNNIINRSEDFINWKGTSDTIDFYVSSDSIPSFFTEESLENDINAYLTNAGRIRTPLYSSFVSFSVYFIIGTIMILVTVPILVNDFSKLLVVGPNRFFNELMVSIGIFYAFAIGGNMVQLFIFRIFSYSPQTSTNQFSIEYVAKSSPLAFFIIALTACTIGPLVEELVFRKTLFSFFNNAKVGLVVSSILFGLIHMTTELETGNIVGFLFGMIPYLISGFGFGFIYMRYKKNIWIPTFVHMITNLIAFLMIL